MNGTGRTYGFLVPAKSDMCAYNGTPFSTAAAFATAMLTPKMCFVWSAVEALEELVNLGLVLEIDILLD